MGFLNLKRKRFNRINLNIKLQENRQMEIESGFSFNVKYAGDEKSCIATLVQNVRLKDEPDLFSLELELVGVFELEGMDNEEDKKMAHIMAYTHLFPVMQDRIARLMTDAGMPPLMIDMAKMRPENVKKDDPMRYQ